MTKLKNIFFPSVFLETKKLNLLQKFFPSGSEKIFYRWFIGKMALARGWGANSIAGWTIKNVTAKSRLWIFIFQIIVQFSNSVIYSVVVYLYVYNI